MASLESPKEFRNVFTNPNGDLRVSERKLHDIWLTFFKGTDQLSTFVKIII